MPISVLFPTWRRRLVLAVLAVTLAALPAAASPAAAAGPGSSGYTPTPAGPWNPGPADCTWFSYLHWRVHACARKHFTTDKLDQTMTRGADAVAGYRISGGRRYRRSMRFATNISYGNLRAASGWTSGRVLRLVERTPSATLIGGERYPVYARADVEYPNGHREVYYFRTDT